MLQFENLYYFLLIIPIFFLLIFLYISGGKNIVFSDTKLIKKVFKTSSYFYKLYYLLIFIIIVLFLAIFSNLIIKYEQDEIMKNGVDIEIVLDVSYSMQAEDFYPNRLEVSKGIINNFLDKIENDRVGLVVFAGKAFTSLPLNFDYEISKNIIEKISVDTINQNNYNTQGTAIGDALIIASKGFEDYSKDREKVIILLTDGDANVGIDPNLALDYIKKQEKNIKVYTIGIGGKNNAYITQKDAFGREVKQKVGGLNEEALKNIAKKSGGKYFRATDKETLEQIFETISSLEKKEIKKDSLTIKKEKNIYLIYLLLIFFVLLFILKYKKNI